MIDWGGGIHRKFASGRIASRRTEWGDQSRFELEAHSSGRLSCATLIFDDMKGVKAVQ